MEQILPINNEVKVMTLGAPTEKQGINRLYWEINQLCF